ncbi:uncharacterized protein K489DRAFT_125080 [Dissoconium aciculare CBS 342.82]|uniref:Uncharacterized protein n=1 Tax=Dissoconium aciculare CBS 342.82 TaxID=1314786 RepID=A0A6J3MFI4_9PEZI|nr:uncharacterized protein K489DRAFT_125080 [Dissoconium aciculare CBS 342.82]KAF1826771.1 hypothetical protein K489DRAFT_125080 [Dissoconium aciculare CBS 342.82]
MMEFRCEDIIIHEYMYGRVCIVRICVINYLFPPTTPTTAATTPTAICAGRAGGLSFASSPAIVNRRQSNPVQSTSNPRLSPYQSTRGLRVCVTTTTHTPLTPIHSSSSDPFSYTLPSSTHFLLSLFFESCLSLLLNTSDIDILFFIHSFFPSRWFPIRETHLVSARCNSGTIT